MIKYFIIFCFSLKILYAQNKSTGLVEFIGATVGTGPQIEKKISSNAM